MNLIDQIRKASEKLEAAQASGQWNDIDFAVNEFFNAADRQAITALLASHDAAVQRAAEMQERCAQVADGYAQIDGTQIAADDYDRGWMRGASRIAAAIRAIKE